MISLKGMHNNENHQNVNGQILPNGNNLDFPPAKY